MTEQLLPPREARRVCGGISSATMYRLIAAGDFPRPVVLSRKRDGSPARIAFLESEIGQWIARKVEAHRSGEAA